ncbi:hypothetical protein JD969_09850 [Planctomycetota bacterium]|nr:hypothetical protein JD969_09850 [Planctomycetota bacterium]
MGYAYSGETIEAGKFDSRNESCFEMVNKEVDALLKFVGWMNVVVGGGLLVLGALGLIGLRDQANQPENLGIVVVAAIWFEICGLVLMVLGVEVLRRIRYQVCLVLAVISIWLFPIGTVTGIVSVLSLGFGTQVKSAFGRG